MIALVGALERVQDEKQGTGGIAFAASTFGVIVLYLSMFQYASVHCTAVISAKTVATLIRDY